MQPLSIQKYVLYCMGEGWVDQKKYASDLAQTRAEDRVMQNQAEQLLAFSKKMAALPSPMFQSQVMAQAQPQPQPGLLGFIQQIPQNIGQFAALLADKAKQQAESVKQLIEHAMDTLFQFLYVDNAAEMDHALKNILTFFLGRKRDKEDVKKLRDDDDFAVDDIFTKRTVESGAGAGDQAGGQK